MASAEVEPFPPLQSHLSKQTVARREGTLRRRKSSMLGAELPGDNDVAAFATLGKGSPPASPTEATVRPASTLTSRPYSGPSPARLTDYVILESRH